MILLQMLATLGIISGVVGAISIIIRLSCVADKWLGQDNYLYRDSY